MYLRITLMLLLFNFVRTSENIYEYGQSKDVYSEVDGQYTIWRNKVSALGVQKREAQIPQTIQSEGGLVESDIRVPISDKDKEQPKDQVQQPVVKPLTVEVKNDTISKPEVPKVSGNAIAANETVSTASSTNNSTSSITSNSTTSTSKVAPNQLDLSNPGVLKRGLIVFGGFALLAVAYYVFFKRKNNKNDANNTHNSNDTNQFRYGVLQSDDQRDNLELSRIPLTMESDEDDDEDLEIFDLEQKKKSLSYINLQPNDDDFDMPTNFTEKVTNDRDNMLLDIEDAPSDTLINWSNNQK